MQWYDLIEIIEPYLKKGNLDKCIKIALKEFVKLEPSPFQLITNSEFDNNINEIVFHLSEFIKQSNEKFNLKAVYIEMNGFDLNPDRWYFDFFSYNKYVDLTQDVDWLSDWQNDYEYIILLSGMEELQLEYKKFMDKLMKGNTEILKYSKAKDFCSFIVVLKFQKLIKESIPLIGNLNVPLIVTGHDYDFFYEYNK